MAKDIFRSSSLTPQPRRSQGDTGGFGPGKASPEAGDAKAAGLPKSKVLNELDELEQAEADFLAQHQPKVEPEIAPSPVPASEPPPAVTPPAPVAKPSAAAAAPDGSKGFLAALAALGRSEKLSLAGGGVFVLLSGLVFLKYLHAYPEPVRDAEIPARFAAPVAGKLATFAAGEGYWRERTEEDRVQSTERILPVAQLRLDPAASGTGFVRVEFLDSERKIRGDIAVLTVEGGRFKDSGRGEKISADGAEVTVAGTVGFSSETLFRSYVIDTEPRWAIRLREGADYADGPWTVLGSALLADEQRNANTAAE